MIYLTILTRNNEIEDLSINLSFKLVIGNISNGPCIFIRRPHTISYILQLQWPCVHVIIAEIGRQEIL